MTDDELKNLDREVKEAEAHRRRTAAQLHDLVEERLAGRLRRNPRHRPIHLRRVQGLGQCQCQIEGNATIIKGIQS